MDNENRRSGVNDKSDDEEIQPQGGRLWSGEGWDEVKDGQGSECENNANMIN